MPNAGTKPDRGSAVSFPLVSTVFVVLLALGVGGGFWIHHRYIGFERVVAWHAPADAALVVRWDVEKVTLFEPTRHHLLTLVDAAGPAMAAPRGAAIARLSGENLGRDLREAQVVFGPEPGAWAVLAGGPFRADALVRAAASVLAPEGWQSPRASRVIGPSGVALGAGEDGVLALASDGAMLERVAKRAPGPLGIERTGAGSLLLRAGEPGLPDAARSLVETLGSVRELRVRATWASPLPVEVEVSYAGEAPADAPARIRRVVEELLGSEHLTRVERGSGPLSVERLPPDRLLARLRLDDAALGHLAERARGVALARFAGRSGGK